MLNVIWVFDSARLALTIALIENLSEMVIIGPNYWAGIALRLCFLQNQ